MTEPLAYLHPSAMAVLDRVAQLYRDGKPSFTGYELVKLLGATNPGNVYGMLHRLEQRGYLSSFVWTVSDREYRYYRLTGKRWRIEG